MSERPILLVPVDFSPHSDMATRIAFHIASILNADIAMLYAFEEAFNNIDDDLPDDLKTIHPNFSTNVEIRFQKAQAEKRFAQFTDNLRHQIAQGTLPPVHFTTEINDGLPEDCIKSYAKKVKPLLIIMGSRGAGKKATDKIGSVTIETFDISKYPVLAIPFTDFSRVSHFPSKIALFTETGSDITPALTFLSNMFPPLHLNITIVNLVQPQKEKTLNTTKLIDSLSQQYPNYKFQSLQLSLRNLIANFSQIQEKEQFEFLIIPSPHRNFLARLFNPGPAHRLLFHIDLPMLVFPINK